MTMRHPSFYIGIDIGGTKIAGGVIASDGRVHRIEERPTPSRQGGAAVLKSALDVAKNVLPRGAVLAGIGVGAGGQIDASNGVVVSATDILPGWAGIRIKDAFVGEFSIENVAVDNDVNALASGEFRFGAAAGHDTVVFLALGTGVGGALLIDGKLHRGANWTGGEFGHILLTFDTAARRDAEGRMGTLEVYASGPGLLQTWREMTGDSEPQVTGRDIAEDAMRSPGGVGAAAITRTGEYLGYGLASLANALDPNIFVIGGGLAALDGMLLGPARRILLQRCLSGPRCCPVVTAALGKHASVIGAASLAM